MPDLAHLPVQSLPVSKVHVLPGRARKDFGDIKELAQNIKERGLINPITVVPRPDGEWTLLAGERRLRAHIALERSVIDARIFPENGPLVDKLVELDENIHRSQLSWPEEIALKEEIHSLLVKINNEKKDKGEATENWTTDKTAAHLGESAGGVRLQIGLAKKLKERPDFAKRFAALPLKQVISEIKKAEEAEKVERLAANGTLKLSENFLLGDCRELLKSVPSNSVDLILTDPPYGIPVLEESEGGTKDTTTYTALLKHTDNLSLPEVNKLLEAVIPELYRVLKPGGHLYIFFCYENFCNLRALLWSNKFLSQPEPLTWYKGRTTSGFTGARYMPCSEPLFFCWKPLSEADLKCYPLTTPGKTLLEFPPPKVRSHPFEKPETLLRDLINRSSSRGQLVLDPFAGTGSVLRASKGLGRSFWGCELSPDHFYLGQSLLLEVK